MKIGIDLDEILADFTGAFIEYHNDTYNTNSKREDFSSYCFSDVWGGTQEELIEKIYDFHKTHYFKNIQPIPGSQEAINRLKQDHELFIITSRQNDVAEDTREWVNRYFPSIFSDIIITNNHSLEGERRTKREYCELLNINTLIDDQLKYALECLAPERNILLLDYPWNRAEELPEGIKRVYSWQEIIDSVK